MVRMNYRHGDLGLVGVKSLPKGLKESKTEEIMRGSNNNSHSFSGGKLYLKQKGDFVIGYLKAGKGCKLYHIEHGKVEKGKTLREVKIKEGVYELRRQCEDTNEGMKQVVD